MKKQLILFNGGLQTKVAPHLADVTQAISCVNIDLDKGSIYPYKDFVIDNTVTATGYNAAFFDGQLITNSDEADNRSYAEFGNRLYWSNGSFGAYGIMRWNGTSEVNAVAPTVNTYGAFTLTPTGANGFANDTYAYCYTVVDSDGIESAPSHITNITPVNQNVSISLDPTSVEDVVESVSKRKIYRTGGSNPTFNLIAELEHPTLTYVDDTRDLDVSRIELSTFDSYAPPPTITNLIENNGTMWGSVGDRVYFSKEGQPEFWGSLDFLTLSGTCTGIGSFRDLVVAFTETSTYVIRGWNKDNIEIEKLPYDEGCTSHGSIANVTESLMWSSKNGICMFNGSEIFVVTKDTISWDDEGLVGTLEFDDIDSSFDSNVGYNVSKALGLHGKYYAIFQNGIGVIDLEKRAVASTIVLEGSSGLFYNNLENRLSVIKDDLSVMIFNKADTNISGVWKTPELHEGDYSSIKHFRRIKFDKAPNTVIVYMNEEEILTVNGQDDIYLPAGTIGRAIQLEIQTNIEIRSVEIEYGIM